MTNAAFITGANRGIGRSIALRLANLQYDLFLLARDEEALSDVAEECRNLGVQVGILPGELGDNDYIGRAIASAIDRFGAIDVLVNNAGAAKQQAVQDADLIQWRDVMEVNFHAIASLSSRILPGMIERQSGTIINISSLSGRNASAESGIYCASKHALNGFSECMFEDVRDQGIKVSTIMPGFVETDLTRELGMDNQRMIRPDDIADSIEYVLSVSTNCCPTEIVLRPQFRP